MEKENEIVTLSDGREITISENDWGMSRKLNRLHDEMEAEIKIADGSTGPMTALESFKISFYPMMAAVVIGEPVMSPEDAFSLPHTDLDNWYMAVWRQNAEWFDDPAPKDFGSELVTLRDGSVVQLAESKGRPSFVLRVAHLEEIGMEHPKEDPEERLFQQVFYPKMAGCIVGDPPEENEMRSWPTAEINKVYEAAKRMNPSWFFVLDAISEQARDAEEKKRE